jgi:hypothetical protein
LRDDRELQQLKLSWPADQHIRAAEARAINAEKAVTIDISIAVIPLARADSTGRRNGTTLGCL